MLNLKQSQRLCVVAAFANRSRLCILSTQHVMANIDAAILEVLRVQLVAASVHDFLLCPIHMSVNL